MTTTHRFSEVRRAGTTAPPARSGLARASASLEIERRLVRLLLRGLGSPPLRFELWDGRSVQSGDGEPVASLRIRDRGTLWRLCTNPQFQFGETYSAGRLEVAGDLVEVLGLAHHAPRPGAFRTLAARVLRGRARSNRKAGSRDNIHRHYDLGNDFYRLWLDRELAYTCAYYSAPGQSLEQAQSSKMEHVCRKLELLPGQRVVEAGSGWGGFALYMARHHGVTVKSYNISHEQVSYARSRLRDSGLGGRVEFIEADYRDIRGEFDVFVSIGMLEHVGRKRYRELSRVIDRVLTPNGRGLIHTIGRSQPQPLNPWIERRIFPGAYPPSLGEMMDLFEPADFSVLDVENLRLHYAQTLRDWLARYEAAAGRVRELFDERFVRAWRLYLSGSIAAFENGSLQLYQVLFNRAASRRVPMTREHLYDSPGACP